MHKIEQYFTFYLLIYKVQELCNKNRNHISIVNMLIYDLFVFYFYFYPYLAQAKYYFKCSANFYHGKKYQNAVSSPGTKHA